MYAIRHEEGEPWVADGNGVHFTVDDGGKAFMRVAIKGVMSPSAHEVRWLVGELNGVRVYVSRDTNDEIMAVCLTTQDIYP